MTMKIRLTFLTEERITGESEQDFQKRRNLVKKMNEIKDLYSFINNSAPGVAITSFPA